MKPPLRVVPVTLEQAREFVSRLHRHHPAPVGHRFSVGAWDVEACRLVGVAVVGRPVARMLDQRRMVEVTRLCTDGTANACSLLYGAAARAAGALGYFCAITYTLSREDGASLRASGWWGEADATAGNSWSVPSRPRVVNEKSLGPKWRWVRFLSEWPDALPPEREETESTQLPLTWAQAP
jgi:hypothetical protein